MKATGPLAKKGFKAFIDLMTTAQWLAVASTDTIAGSKKKCREHLYKYYLGRQYFLVTFIFDNYNEIKGDYCINK